MQDIEQSIKQVEKKYQAIFEAIDDLSLFNQRKVLECFKECRVEARHFNGTTGYGYDDIGRIKLEELYAAVFGAQSAFVRLQFGSATHALVITLRALLKPNDRIVSITGQPYDTVYSAIRSSSTGQGGCSDTSLESYGVKYDQVDLIDGSSIDLDQVNDYVSAHHPRVVFLQRSRGYQWREAITIDQIKEVSNMIHDISPDSLVFVDNCYGEFTETLEPTQVGADICVGSLIKNPGGGLAATGAYVVGRKDVVDTVSAFFYSPNLRDEIGSYESGYRMVFQGLFMAPHTVAQSLKGAVLFSAIYHDRGYSVMPLPNSYRSDITQSILLQSREELVNFCNQVQSTSPIDSHLELEPWDMPGYTEKIIMAAGTFVQGASIELSADAPVSEPYIAYIQGGLTYEHCKLSLIATLTNTTE